MTDPKVRPLRGGIDHHRVHLAAVILGGMLSKPDADSKEHNHHIDKALDAADRLVARAQERQDAEDDAADAAEATAAKGAGKDGGDGAGSTGSEAGSEGGAGAAAGSAPPAEPAGS